MADPTTAAMTARTVRIDGDGGDRVEAHLAGPAAPDPRCGLVVIHHMPGYDRASALASAPAELTA